MVSLTRACGAAARRSEENTERGGISVSKTTRFAAWMGETVVGGIIGELMRGWGGDQERCEWMLLCE